MRVRLYFDDIIPYLTLLTPLFYITEPDSTILNLPMRNS